VKKKLEKLKSKLEETIRLKEAEQKKQFNIYKNTIAANAVGNHIAGIRHALDEMEAMGL
jgi:hypothetical protein